MQRDRLEAGGTGTLLLDSKILARLAGAGERLFHRTLSLRRRPTTTRTSTTTITVPIWVRSLYSALSHPLSPSSSWSLFSIRSSSSLPPPLSLPFLFAFSTLLLLPSPQTDGDATCIPNFQLFLPVRSTPPHLTLSRRFLYIFLPNSDAEIHFVLILFDDIFRDGLVENLTRGNFPRVKTILRD